MKRKIFKEVDSQLEIIQEQGKGNYDKIISQYFTEQDSSKNIRKQQPQRTWINKLAPIFSCVIFLIAAIALVFGFLTPKYSAENVIAETVTQNNFNSYCKSVSVNLDDTYDYEISRWYDKKSGDTLKYIIEYKNSENLLHGYVSVSSNKRYKLSLDTEEQPKKKTINDVTVTYVISTETDNGILTGKAYFQYNEQKFLVVYVCQATNPTNVPTEQTFWDFFDALIDFV